ncbi:MAG: hypothetical protein Q8O41_07890 [Candidatus Methanoperedens sp.]|nr:hypothetical protein [Candidatus Methanoperedens sp.]
MNKLPKKTQDSIDQISYILPIDDNHAVQFMMIIDKIIRLENTISDRMAVLEAKLDDALCFNQQSVQQTVIIEQMDKDTAKNRVLQHIKEHKTSDIIELHKEIKCDIKMLIEILDELSAEGKIGASY